MATGGNHEHEILLAEDSEDDFYFFQRAFRKAGVNCALIRAANGKAAIDLLSRDRPLPLLIFLDLKMPVLSGFDVLEWMVSARLNPAPKVFVLSGSNDQADMDRAASLGAAGYLVKPISAELLKERLSAALKLRQSSRAEMGAAL